MSLIEREACHRRTRLIICCAHIPTVLCRLPSRSLTSGVEALTHKKGKAHLCFVQGSVTTTAITIHRRPGLRTSPLSAGEGTIAVMASEARLAAPASFQRFIDHEIPAFSGWHKGLDDQQEQLATHRERRPSCSVEDLMEATPVGCLVVAAGAQGCCGRAASLRKP